MQFLKTIFFDIQSLISGGGYSAYYKIGPPFTLDKAREIYKKSECDFVIRRDIYCKNLTLERFKNTLILRVVLFIYEYVRHVYIVIKDPNWLYTTNFDSNEVCEAFFRNNDRHDRKPVLGHHELSINIVRRSDIVNSLIAILPCLSFKKLFKKRLLWQANKFKYCKLPKKIIISECESMEERSLYYYANQQNVEINIYWPYPSSYFYSKDELMNNQNLDMPVKLIREKYVNNIIHKVHEGIQINGDVLILVPADYGINTIIEWVINCKNTIHAKRYFFSLHPLSSDLMPHINNLNFGYIDDQKDNYLDKYEHFIGISSSFFEIAAKEGKNIIPIAFSELELEYCDILNSNRNVYDAVEYCNNMIKNNERN